VHAGPGRHDVDSEGHAFGGLTRKETAIVNPQPSRDALLSGADERSLPLTYLYPRGAELFIQGEMLQEVLRIVSGIVKLTLSDAAGRQSIAGLALAGDWLGTAAVIVRQPTPVSAVTCSDAVLRRMPAATFRRQLLHDSELSLQIHQAHSRELCKQTTWISKMCSLGSLERLQCVLCRFAATHSRTTSGSSIKLQLPIHHWELAEFIGVRPEHLSRLLAELEAKDLIRRERGWIVIPDRERLCEDYDASCSQE
jgi:CRP-like cAMP-binding protein